MSADGVLPDRISRKPDAQSWLVFVDLQAGTDVQTWLTTVATTAVGALTGTGNAVCTTAFGPTLFDKAGTAAHRPLGLNATLPGDVPADPHDVLFYVFTTSDADVAWFLRTVSAGPGTAAIGIERGYQRSDKREVFGQLDGLRNVPAAHRGEVAFIGADQAGEPGWATGGSYLAYLKIEQHLDTWGALAEADREQIIGRRADGSRLDQPTGTVPSAHGPDEPPFGDTAAPPVCSHIRKTGPRGTEQDPVRIFRRGTPYVDAGADGKLIEGLQFVSYQADIDDFLTILQRWMLNPNFPTIGAGVDSLFDPARALTSFRKGGLYFAVPHDRRFLGAGMFDTDTRDRGGLVIRLVVLDAAGAPDRAASLEGAQFQITGDPTTPAPITVTTDAAGRAVTLPLPIGVPLLVQQTAAPSGSVVTPGPNPQTVTLERCQKARLTFQNTRDTGNPGGYGAG